jgi:protein TonB
LISGILHLIVLGVMAWSWSVLPDRHMREGEVITLLAMAPSTAEPQPVDVERPIQPPSTSEQRPQQLEPPKSELPKNNPQLRRDIPRPPATPSPHDTPPPVLIAERQKQELALESAPPPQPTPKPHRQQLVEAVMTVRQPVESGARVDQAPRKLASNPKPEYPAAARAAGQSGRVVLLIKISATGRVSQARVLNSSGVASLDQSALTTVQNRWRFEPARRAGVAVPLEVTIGINFGFDQP